MVGSVVYGWYAAVGVRDTVHVLKAVHTFRYPSISPFNSNLMMSFFYRFWVTVLSHKVSSEKPSKGNIFCNAQTIDQQFNTILKCEIIGDRTSIFFLIPFVLRIHNIF